MNGSAWGVIFRLRQAREPLEWWKHVLGTEFGGFLPFLVRCSGVAGTSYPCPDTGLILQIRESAGRFRAFPTGDAAEDADDRALAWEDVQAWRLDQAALRRGVAEALGLKGTPGNGSGADTEFAGFCERGGARKRVYLCHAEGSEAAVRFATDAGQTPEAGCLVFAERHAAAAHVLQARGVALVALAECMTLEGGSLKGACAGACQAFPSDINNRELKAHFDQRFDSLGREFSDLQKENEALKQDLARVLSNLARKVDPVFFQWIFVILGTGSVNAAARALDVPGATFADRLQRYVARGGVYKTLYAMVGARKKGAGQRRIERFNELFEGHQGEQAVGGPGVWRELLDGLEALNGANWKAMREELIGIVRSEYPEE